MRLNVRPSDNLLIKSRYLVEKGKELGKFSAATGETFDLET
jgi:hypothetical protein